MDLYEKSNRIYHLALITIILYEISYRLIGVQVEYACAI